MTHLKLLFLSLTLSQAFSAGIKSRQTAGIDICRHFHKARGFFRDPGRNKSIETVKSTCDDFYICVADSVFKMSCSPYTLFDIVRQACARTEEVSVANCLLDTMDEYQPPTTPKPLFNTEIPLCSNENELACGDGECRSREEFCDKIFQCADWSDESMCALHEDPNRSPICDEEACQLPDCYCTLNISAIPGGLDVKEVPQLIMITFDNAINDKNAAIYNSIFLPSRLNPNGCPIRGTFFVNHEYTNYQFLEYLHNQNHEIGIKSVGQRHNEQYWINATADTWRQELEATRLIVSKFGRIPHEDIRGVRAPYLKAGGNAQFIAMEDGGFLYDSSLSVPFLDTPIYPYTLEYRMPHKCYGKDVTCPARSFPNIWEIPLNQFVGFDGNWCSIISQCSHAPDSNTFYRILKQHFERHYFKNRAPIILSFMSSWLSGTNMNGFLRWLDEVLENKNVYFVTNYQVIEWMRNPTPIQELDNFEPLLCPERESTVCATANGCLLGSSSSDAPSGWMFTCEKCPGVYPYLHNPFGEITD